MLPAPTIADLATFTGRPVGTFSAYAAQALSQAALLLSLLTHRTEAPEDPDLLALMNNAIMEMADRILLEQPYAAAKASPFSSETIGSYSYAKGSTAYIAKSGLPTGLLFWDLAIDLLSTKDSSLVGSGGVAVFERTEVYSDGEGERFVPGPGELAQAEYGFINTETGPRTG